MATGREIGFDRADVHSPTDRLSLMEGLVDHFVTVERLPEEMEFPADLKDRLRYDAQSKRLYFRGYMSKTDFDRICMLTKDWSFRRKLEELFRDCVPEDEPVAKSARGLLALFKRRAVPS